MSDRPVTTDALEALGSIIDDQQKRDAIHLAVYPCVASCPIMPGTDVGLAHDGRAYHADIKECVGIVDSFLKSRVNTGERFWLVIYPRQIKSLRHVWEHPAFPASGETETQAKPAMSRSEEWIREFAASIPLGYDVIMDGAETYVKHGDYLTLGGLLEGESVPDDFWPHYENVTGTRVEEAKRGSFFSCSC